jgi:hypothetical protein
MCHPPLVRLVFLFYGFYNNTDQTISRPDAPDNRNERPRSLMDIEAASRVIIIENKTKSIFCWKLIYRRPGADFCSGMEQAFHFNAH